MIPDDENALSIHLSAVCFINVVLVLHVTDTEEKRPSSNKGVEAMMVSKESLCNRVS